MRNYGKANLWSDAGDIKDTLGGYRRQASEGHCPSSTLLRSLKTNSNSNFFAFHLFFNVIEIIAILREILRDFPASALTHTVSPEWKHHFRAAKALFSIQKPLCLLVSHLNTSAFKPKVVIFASVPDQVQSKPSRSYRCDQFQYKQGSSRANHSHWLIACR